MKKPTILLAVFLISSLTFAQGDLDNQFYFRGGFSSPGWKQYGGTEAIWNADDFNKKKGVVGEIGSIFILKSIPMPDGMAIGINVDYASFYWQQIYADDDQGRYDFLNLRIDTKIGPSFSYSPVNRLVFDAYVKADFSWATVTNEYADKNLSSADTYADYFVLGLSTGLNVRYSVLMLGFEFNTISPKLEKVDEDGNYLGNLTDDSTDKSPLPSLNFTIGLSF